MRRIRWVLILASVLAIPGIAFFACRGKRAPLTADEAFTRGRQHQDEGRWRDAYSHFDHAARLKPEETQYSWAAAQAALKLGLIQPAAEHAREAWNRGLKNRDVYQIRVSAITGDRAARLDKGIAWLRELPDTRERRELEGDLHQSAQNFPECLRIWSEIYSSDPTPALANKIALTRVASGQTDGAYAFLKSCHEAGRLDEEGVGLYATMAAYRGRSEEAAAVFAEGRARFGSSESLRLNEAVFLIMSDRLADAAALLEPLKGASKDAAVQVLHAQARIFLGFIRAAQADARELDALSVLAAGDGPALEGERLYYRALREQSADGLKKARLLLPVHPACEWAFARELARDGAWKESADAYRAVPGLLAGAPVLQIETAQALGRSGRIDDALIALRRVHARRYYTKASLELLRDLASLKGLKVEAAEAQAHLEKRFRDDPSVSLAGGLLALRSGNLEEAASILESLSTRHPDRTDVEAARLAVLFSRKDYDAVLKSTEGTGVAAPGAPIRAAALAMRGREAEALQLYERIVAERQEPATLLSYANLLLRMGHVDRAGETYEKLLRVDSRSVVARLGLASLAARRRDWKAAREHSEAAAQGTPLAFTQSLLAEIELEEGRPDRALPFCNQALGLSPKDERARYLLGVTQLQLGRLDEADATLRALASEKPEAPFIQWQLARVALSRGNLGGSLAIVDAVLARSPQGAAAFQSIRLVLLARLGRATEARDVFNQLASQLPPERAALCDSWLLHQEGRSAEAVSRLRSHLQDPLAAAFWAELTLMEGGSEGVLETLDRHSIEPARWGWFGELARRKDLIDIAAACYRRALRGDPENSQLLNNYAYASLLLETFDEADVLAAARKACALVPGNASVIHTYAAVLLRCGKARECLELLDQSPPLVRNSAKLQFAKGNAHERLEQWAPALAAYTACMTLPETEGIAAGELSRPELRKRIEQVRARTETRR